MSTGDDEPGTTGCDAAFRVDAEPGRGRKFRIKVRFGDKLVAVHGPAIPYLDSDQSRPVFRGKLMAPTVQDGLNRSMRKHTTVRKPVRSSANPWFSSVPGCERLHKLFYSDTLDPHDAAARAKWAQALVAKACQKWRHGVLAAEDVESKLLAAADRDAAPGGGAEQPIESVDDPDRLARLFIASSCQGPDGPTLRSYQGRWFRWDGISYFEVPEGELDAELAPRIKAEFDEFSVETKKAAPKVTKTLLANVRLALKSKLLVPASRGMPCWIGDGPWPVGEVLPAKNGLFHLPALASGVEAHLPPTPQFFSTFALDYELEANPEPPVAWLAFLNQLWPDAPDCIEALQEFLGYCLTPDTSQQKILLVIGPPRSGKGTIAKVATGLVGARNVAGPTASSLKTNFGLQDLVGKPLAILADAQLKKHDDGLVERLKMISGEDLITIDKKYADPFTVKLPTRLVIMSNDLPRFKDTSGALAHRMILLPRR